MKWNRLLHEDLEELYKEKALPEPSKSNKKESLYLNPSNHDTIEMKKFNSENDSNTEQIRREDVDENAERKDKMSSEEKRRR